MMEAMDTKNEIVLITGATGLVGAALLRHLEGCSVRMLTTNRQAATAGNYYYWDPGSGQVDTEAFRDVSVIIHLAGAGIADKRWTARRKELILQSRVESLRLIGDILKQGDHRVRQLICAGAIGWYGDDPSGTLLFGEEAPPDEHSFLGRVCREWEAAAFALEELGIAVAVLRTGMVLARQGGALPPIVRSMLTPLVPVLGSGRQLVSWIHLDDLAAMYIYIMEQRLSGVYNAVAGQVLSHKEMVKRIARFRKGRAYLCMPVPALVLKIVLGQMAGELLLSGAAVDNGKIRAAGFVFRYPDLDDRTLKTLL